MELKVRNSHGEWYPVEAEASFYDAVIEVPDDVGDRYLSLADEVIRMSDAIEAQVHGTEEA